MSRKSSLNKQVKQKPQKKILEAEPIEEEKNADFETDLLISRKELIILNNEIAIAEERLEKCQLNKEANEFELNGYISILKDEYEKQLKINEELENQVKLLNQETLVYKNKKHASLTREQIDPQIKQKNFEKELNEMKKECIKKFEEFRKTFKRK